MDVIRGVPGNPTRSAGVNGNPLRPGIVRLGQLLSANLNTTADQPFTMGAGIWIPTAIISTNVSTSLAISIAAGGIYTAASKGGSAMVGAGQAYTTLTVASSVLSLTLAISNRRTESTLYLALTTAHGSAATCDLYLFGYTLDP